MFEWYTRSKMRNEASVFDQVIRYILGGLEFLWIAMGLLLAFALVSDLHSFHVAEGQYYPFCADPIVGCAATEMKAYTFQSVIVFCALVLLLALSVFGLIKANKHFRYMSRLMGMLIVLYVSLLLTLHYFGWPQFMVDAFNH